MRTTVSALLLLWGVAAVAQPADSGGGNELVVSLYNQLQALQGEVQTLRGLVEEQGYQLQRLQTESRDRYIDIDRRLSEMTLNNGAQQPFAPAGAGTPSDPGAAANQPFGAPPVPGNTAPSSDLTGVTNNPVSGNGGTSTPLNGSAAPAAGNAGGGGAQPLILDEEEQYRYALNMLLEETQYVQAIDGFQSYIDRFPTGRRLTNALYWRGEALILESRFDEAIADFTRLMEEFPQDAKAPGAMLKLGVAYDKKGDRRAAEDLWRELPTRYPDAATEIKAAQDYLRR